MEYAAIISAVLGLFSLIVNSVSQDNATARQAAHDREMADLQFQNEKKLMDYQNEVQQNTNTIATQKGHALSAGVSPALLFGSLPQQASISGGSSSAGASTLPFQQLAGRLDPGLVSEQLLTAHQQKLNEQKLASDMTLQNRQGLYYDALTAGKIQDNKIQKRLERTIVDQALANLESSRAQSENLRFMTERGNALLPHELEQAGLINKETAARIDKVVSDTLKNRYEMREITANIKRVEAATAESWANKDSIQESVRRSAISRIMSEFGLNNVKYPPSMRSKAPGSLYQALHGEQMRGAYAALISMGFSESEAAGAVLYYVTDSAKDITPSVVNSASRILSAVTLKK